MFGGIEFRFCHLFKISDNTNMTESELCPPDTCMKYLIKKGVLYFGYIPKNHAIDVRGDRIPILSSFEISDNANMTESELCPPDSCVK